MPEKNGKERQKRRDIHSLFTNWAEFIFYAINGSCKFLGLCASYTPYTTEVIIENLLILTANTLLIKTEPDVSIFCWSLHQGSTESLTLHGDLIACKVTGGYASVYYTLDGDLHTA